MKRLALALGLAASATLSSAVALADEPVVGPPALEDKPLVLRETGAQPQQAAAAPSSSITLLKGLGVAGIGVVAFALFRRKRAQNGMPTGATVKIVARTSLGMRTEVCVVEVGGERLVLGVTPTTVTTLSVLGDAPAELGEIADVAATTRGFRHDDREIERIADRSERIERAERAERPIPATSRTLDRARAALDEATEVEPMSALTRLLETARRRTDVTAPAPTRQRAVEASRAAASIADDDDAPVDIVPARAPAPRKTTASRRIEEQVRGLNTPRSRRAS